MISRVRYAMIALGVVSDGCTPETRSLGDGTGAAGGSATNGSSSGSAGTAAADSTSSGSEGGSTSAGSSSDGPWQLSDLPPPDGFPAFVPGWVPLPTTCEDAVIAAGTLGCVFFAVDLDQLDAPPSDAPGDPLPDAAPLGVRVINPHEAPVTVTASVRIGGEWIAMAEPWTIPARSSAAVDIPEDRHREGTGTAIGGAVRLDSDLPVGMVQIAPGGANLATLGEATTLLPDFALGFEYRTVDAGPAEFVFHEGSTSVTIVATVDGTQVEVTPSAATLAGGGIEAGVAAVPFLVNLDAGDVANIEAEVPGSLTGTSIIADAAHPIAVFAAAECATVGEAGSCCCDHLEEQLLPTSLWGQHHVALSFAPNPNVESPYVWIIVAAEDGTTVSFDAGPAIEGVPVGLGASVDLDAGASKALRVSGRTDQANSASLFRISATKPVALFGYAVSGSETMADKGSLPGDPALVQVPAVERGISHTATATVGSLDEQSALVCAVAPDEAIRFGKFATEPFTYARLGEVTAAGQTPMGAHPLAELECDSAFVAIVTVSGERHAMSYVAGLSTAGAR